MHDHAHNQEKVTFSWGILHWRSTFGKCQCAQGLGLFTAGDLISRNQHRDKITARANWVLYDWLKELVEISKTSALKTLYCGLVRSLLQYSCETWNPHTQRTIDKFKAVQRRATRWITKSDDDYDLRLSKLKLLSIFNRR